MGEIPVRIEKGWKDKKRGGMMVMQAGRLFFLLTGVFGLLLLIYSSRSYALGTYTVRRWAVGLTALAVCVFLWYLDSFRRKLLPIGCVFLVLACALPCLAWQDELAGQMHALFGYTDAGRAADATGAAMFLAAALSVLLFLLAFVFGMYKLLYLLITVLLLAGPALGSYPGYGTVLLLSAFQLSFWGMRGRFFTGNWKREEERKAGTERAREEKAGAAAGKTVALCAGAFALLFLFGTAVVRLGGEELYGTAYLADSLIQTSAMRAAGRQTPFMQGAISRGNLYPQGEQMLELVAARRPEESLYLKQFEGGDYAEGVWLEDRDEEIFQRMEVNTLHWNEWSDTIPGMYESLYYVMNQSMWREEPVENMQLWIRPEAAGGSRSYLPYYHMWYSGGRQEDGSYQVNYFERKDMDIDWENVTGFFEAGRDWYYEIQKAYEREARQVYTEVAPEDIPRLAQLCQDYLGDAAEGAGTAGDGRTAPEEEDVEAVTAFILETLWSRASYTRTPGMYPLNAEPVEYFLFESGEGYCQHFASAAVLMFRMLGVPARYAAGCVVYPEDFTRQEDGTWRAVATDESAHAWAEIFVPDYGWVPVEATPPATDEESVYWTAGLDGGATALAGLLADAGRAEGDGTETRQRTESEAASRDDGQAEEGSADVRDGSREGIPDIGRALLPQAILAAAILGCLPYGRRMWRLYQRNTSWGCREIFAEMLDMLHGCGLSERYEGLEADFPAQLARMVPAITKAQAEEIVRIVSEEAYGGREAGRQELAFVRNRYYCAAQSLCQKQGWRRRLAFCYRYGYI